ncbi:hypothetical protein [Neorhizobium vignae]|uniref:hypothetical protein n=1 Tax=Neorhizobium vignae TaxID=690585 RepID=UPI00068B6FC6|nr:hypothetical protein [Neorhizobium vignae]
MPFAAAFELAQQFLDGKIVIDTNNFYPDRDGSLNALDRRETTTSQMIANHFQGVMIFKALNAILEKDLLDPFALRNRAKGVLPIAGDDAAAKVIVTI